MPRMKLLKAQMKDPKMQAKAKALMAELINKDFCKEADESKDAIEKGTTCGSLSFGGKYGT